MPTKTIEHTLTVQHPAKFMSDKKAYIMQRLKAQFEHTCYNNALIIDIKEINKMSMCRLQTTNNSSEGYINVCFTANVVYYYIDDIVSNVTIHLSNNQILGSNDDIYFSLLKDTTNKTLDNGQKVPIVITDKILYNTGSKHVNAMGQLLLPARETDIFKIKGFLKTKHYNKLSELIGKIKAQSGKLESDKAKTVIGYLKSYNKNDSNGQDILKLVEKAKDNEVDVTGYWRKNLRALPHQPLFIRNIDDKSDRYIETTITNAFTTMLHKLFNIRQAIIGITTYTDTEMKESQNLWKLMMRSKLD